MHSLHAGSWSNRCVHRLPVVVAALLLFTACGARASRLPHTQLLTFGVSHREGSTHFVIRTDRTAEYVSHGGPGGARKVQGIVTREELEKLAALLDDKGFCSLVSTRSKGVPDEARPSVSVRMSGLDCEVQMWDNEFSDDAEAKAALAAIEALGAAVRDRGK